MSLRRTAFLIATLVAVGAVVSACGRHSEPLTPYEAALEARKEARDAGEPLPPEPTPPNPDRPFILDRLLR